MSMFDVPKKELCLEFFKDDKVIPSIRLKILQSLKEFIPDYLNDITEVWIMGALASYQYSSTSDLDIQIGLTSEVFDKVPWKILKQKNGQLFNKTQHPLNFFIFPSFRPKNPENFPEAYDLLGDSWLKHSHQPTQEELRYFDINLPYLNLLANNANLQFEQLLNAPSDRLKEEAEDVAEIYHELDKDRKITYAWGLYPKKSIQNAAYKYVEHKSLAGDYAEVIERLLRKKYETNTGTNRNPQ